MAAPARSLPTRQADPDNLWAPHTLAFFGGVVAANVVFDLAILAASIVEDAQIFALTASLRPFVRPALSALVIGSFLAQTVILGIWTALFPGKSTTRWLAGTLVLMAAAIALGVPVKLTWQLSIYLFTGVLDVDLWGVWADALAAAPVWLMLFCFVQVPFWIARRWAGMRVTRDPAQQPAPTRTLQMLDLFGILSYLGIAIAVARIAAPEVNVLAFVATMTMVIGVMWLMGISLLVTVFGSNHLLVRVLVVAGICELFALSASAVYFQFDKRIAWSIILCVFHSVAMAIAVAALVNGAAARAFGYRLIWAWPRSKVTAPAELATTTSPATSPRP